MDNEELKKNLIENQAEVRCPEHGCLIGHYDVRQGVRNVVFYCPKCRMEYGFTIPANATIKKNQTIIKKNQKNP
jgi:hypothetical protein